MGNNKSLNKSTNVCPVKSATVVPASIPPTSVSISKVGLNVVLYIVNNVVGSTIPKPVLAETLISVLVVIPVISTVPPKLFVS